MRLLLLATLAGSLAFHPSAHAGPTSAAPAAVKNKDIEDAGEALQKGKVDEALKLLQDAVKKDPKLPPAKLMLARLFMATNEQRVQAQGRTILEQVSLEETDHPEVYLTLGSLALADGRLSEALLDCNHALELAKASRFDAAQQKTFQREARGGLSMAYEQRKDWTNTAKQLQAWLELEPKNGQARQRYARCLFFQNKPDDAFTELKAAVADDSTLEPATLSMGRLFMATNKPKEATSYFEKAVQAAPNNPRVQRTYAEFLLQQDKTEQAKIHAEIALRSDPKDRDNQFVAGLVARAMEEFGTAQKVFNDMYTTNPQDFAASNQLALVLADQNDDASKTRAERLAELNTKTYSQSPDALSTMGYVCFRNKRYDDAERALAPILKGGQLTQDAAYTFALILIERGSKEQKENAKKLLAVAVEQPGLFIYRKKATAELDKLKKELPDVVPPKDAAPKSNPKGS